MCLQNPGFGFSEPKALGEKKKKKKSWRFSAIPNCGWIPPIPNFKGKLNYVFLYSFTLSSSKCDSVRAMGLPRKLPRLLLAVLLGWKWAWPTAISFAGGWSFNMKPTETNQLDTAWGRLADMCGPRKVNGLVPASGQACVESPWLPRLALFSLLIHSCHLQPFPSGSTSF